MLNRILQKKPKEKRHLVSLDRYGNAIPDVLEGADEGLSTAFRVVEKREVVITYADPKMRKSDLKVIERSLLEKIMPWSGKEISVQTPEKNPQAQQQQALVEVPIQAQAEQEMVQSRFAQVFQRLHNEFNQREQHLERRLNEVSALHRQLQSQATSQTRKKINPWLMFAMGGAAMFAVSYMLLVLTNMQNSMQGMSGDMASMNGHVGAMAADTQAMNANTQAMNANMQTMNESIYHLNGNVGQMNQQVGTLSRAVEPMANMAAPMRPFTKMFSSFRPF